MSNNYEAFKKENKDLNNAYKKLQIEYISLNEEFIQLKIEKEKQVDYKNLYFKLNAETKSLVEKALEDGIKEGRDKQIEKMNQLEIKANQYDQIVKNNQQLEADNSKKDIDIQNLRRIVKSQQKAQNPDYNEQQTNLIYKEANEEVVALRKKLQKSEQRFSKLSENMDNILAENRVLRRLAQVPENFGFDLEEIKDAERKQIEDYKGMIRTLEKFNEELEGERLQLRNRLRTLSNLYNKGPKEGGSNERYKNLNKEELVLLDNFLLNLRDPLFLQKVQQDGRYDKEQLIRELQDQVSKCEREHKNMTSDGKMSNDRGQFYSREQIEELKDQNSKLKQMVQFVTEQLQNMNNTGRYGFSGYNVNPNSFNPDPNSHEADPNSHGHQHLQGESANLARPPQPIPGSYGNWDDIQQVRSFKFKQMIPADIFELYSGAGFDQILAKYQICQLQVMNLETMKILKVKEEEYKNMEGELEEMKDQFKKCLLIQDNLYESYYVETTKLKERENILRTQLEDKTGEVQKLKEELEEYRQQNKLNMKNDSNKQLQKIAELTHKISILDVNLIKISRKYACLKSEYDEINESYKNLSSDFSVKETQLIEKIHNLLDWKKKASHYLKVLLDVCHNTVSKSQNNILKNKFEKCQDECANVKERNTFLLSQIQKLKSSEREVDEKNNKIRIMEDEMVELQLESEMIKKMLEMSDSHFKKYQGAMSKLVSVMQTKNISPMQVFSQIDDNRDGKLGPSEFLQAMKQLKVDFSMQEVEILFRFMDFDGNNKIELKEFSRKLRRQGLTIRKQQELIIYNLHQKMLQAGLTVNQTFQAFDKDRSGEVTKEEMRLALKSLMGVDDDTVDYVFKIADTSGDGRITFSEFQALFENIIQDTMRYFNKLANILKLIFLGPQFFWEIQSILKLNRQEVLMNIEELSWQKKLLLSIEEAVHQQGQYIKDLYNFIDNDGNEKITYKEFQGLFQNLKLEIDDESLKVIFKDIDRDGSNTIEYSELMNYIRQAKVEKAKIEKMSRVTKKIREMQKQGAKFESMDQQEVQTLPLETRLEMKIRLMEIKEKNLQSRSDTLMYSLNLTKKENARIQLQLNEREGEILTHMKKFNEAQRLNYKLLNMIQGCETKTRAKQIHNLNKRVLKENVELRSQNKILKDLHEFASNQVKDLLISIERKKFETYSLTETIKELQSESDEKAIVGKIQHTLMVSKYNQAQVNIKYDHLVHDLEKQTAEIKILESELGESRDDAIETREILRQKIIDYEEQITDLRTRILPTINMSKIDEMYQRINELASMKMNLEIQNKKLRDDNHELAIKCDYFEALEQQFDQLRQDLKTKYSDELQHKIIELSLQVSEQKLLEMKAKRDQELAKEKEEYFSRITRQHLEHVKQLETELETVNKKFNERELFWRAKHQEAMEMVMNDKVAKDKEDEAILRLRRDAGKTNKLVGIVRLNKDNSQPVDKQYRNRDDGSDSDLIKDFRLQLKEAQDRELYLKDENDRLIQLNKEISELTKKYDSNFQPSQETRQQVFNEEGEKLALAAQKTISTLQTIIDDKSNELERKEQQIEKMKKDFRTEKEKDSLEMRRLISQINSAPASISLGNQSTFMQGNTHQRNNEYWDDVSTALDEKDKHIEQLSNLRDEIEIKYKSCQRKNIELEEKIKQLEDELFVEKKNNKTQDLEAKIYRMEKLLKERNDSIKDIKKKMTELASDYNSAMTENNDKENQFKDKVIDAQRQNKDLEEKMKTLLQTIREQRKKIEELDEQVKMLKIQGDKNQRDLQKESQKNKSATTSRVEIESQNIAVLDMKKELNKEKAEKTKLLDNLKKLEDEKKELQKRIVELEKKKYVGLFEDGHLIPQNKQNFQTAEDVALQIRKFIQETPSFNFMKELKNNQDRQTGNILSGNLYKMFNQIQLKIKQEDFNLFIKPVTTTQGLRQQAPDQQPLNIHKLYNLVYNLTDAEQQCEQGQAQNIDVQGRSSVQAEQSDGFKPQSTRERFSVTQQVQQQPQGVSKKEEDLLKRNDMLKAQFNNLKDEKERIQKQLNLKSEQCKSLEQQLNKQLNKTGFESLPPSRRSGSFIRNEPAVEAVSELKNMIFELEDEKNTLNQHMRAKDNELKKLKEDKTQLEELIKEFKAQNQKISEQLDNLISEKIHPDDLKQSILLEKDLLIKDIKSKLDKQRKVEQELNERIHELEKENKELKFTQEQVDVQVERLNRRIGELEEVKRSSSHSKANQLVNQQTLKKQQVPRK